MTNEHQSWQTWASSFEESPEYIAENIKLDFALALERRMGALGLSRADLARKLETSPAAITNTLRGDANLSIDRMARLAHALDATVHVHLAPTAVKVRWFEVHNTKNAVPKEQLKSAIAWAKQAGGKDAKRPAPFAA